MTIADNLARIKAQIALSAAKSGRDPESITLVAVTKTIAPPRIQEAIRAGVTAIGENRVQEARTKFDQLEGTVAKHLIGSLQTNKVKLALELFDLIHSVDRGELLLEMARQAERRQRPVEFLIQVNISGEASKHGLPPQELPGFLARFQGMQWLVPCGLMTMAPWTTDPEMVRPQFRVLTQLFNELAASIDFKSSWRFRSMGMSQDYQVAVEEGANLLRIGTAIFQTE